MWNIGIVGCRKIADGHIEEIQRVGCARVPTVCDLEPILAEQLALRYSLPHWYTDFDRVEAVGADLRGSATVVCGVPDRIGRG
jgi:predicted dehydrogenase